jgi:hypothetical protein
MERPISERQCDIGADRGANKAWFWANIDRASESLIILFLVAPTAWAARREPRDLGRPYVEFRRSGAVEPLEPRIHLL